MIFFVGAMSSNPKDAPYGLWSLVGITAFGALIAGIYSIVVFIAFFLVITKSLLMS